MAELLIQDADRLQHATDREILDHPAVVKALEEARAEVADINRVIEESFLQCGLARGIDPVDSIQIVARMARDGVALREQLGELQAEVARFTEERMADLQEEVNAVAEKYRAEVARLQAELSCSKLRARSAEAIARMGGTDIG
ncbi:MAG: hypothetical protein WC869_08290 [Phycisphaerae bacterium]